MKTDQYREDLTCIPEQINNWSKSCWIVQTCTLYNYTICTNITNQIQLTVCRCYPVIQCVFEQSSCTVCKHMTYIVILSKQNKHFTPQCENENCLAIFIFMAIILKHNWAARHLVVTLWLDSYSLACTKRRIPRNGRLMTIWPANAFTATAYAPITAAGQKTTHCPANF